MARKGHLIKAFSTDQFELPLPAGHRFPMLKYRQLRESLQGHETICLLEPPAASDEQLMLCHDPLYVKKLCRGELDEKAMKRIGFPWSVAMVERSRRSVGATIAACEAACEAAYPSTHGSLSFSSPAIAFNLAGGTHHAHYDFGSGYCCFNDAAVACCWMQNQGGVERVAIIDLDVHQGDGTAALLRGRPNTLTCSIHGQSNFPFRKCESDIDIGLPDGTADNDYLNAVQALLEAIDAHTQPSLIIYLAGVDPLREDRLGRLHVSLEGLYRRDQLVLRFAKDRGIPIAIAMAGGYSEPIELTVRAHRQTFECALEVYG